MSAGGNLRFPDQGGAKENGDVPQSGEGVDRSVSRLNFGLKAHRLNLVKSAAIWLNLVKRSLGSIGLRTV